MNSFKICFRTRLQQRLWRWRALVVGQSLRFRRGRAWVCVRLQSWRHRRRQRVERRVAGLSFQARGRTRMVALARRRLHRRDSSPGLRL